MFRHLLFAHYYDMPIKFTDKEVEKLFFKRYDMKNSGIIKKSDALQITYLGDIFSFNQEIVDLRYDLENFNITYIRDTNFEKCTNLKYFKFPHSVTHTILGFRNNTNLQVIDVNEENTNFIFGTYCLYKNRTLKALILRQKFAFYVPEPVYMFYNQNAPEGFKIYVRDELLEQFKSFSNYAPHIASFRPLSEYHENI